MSNTRAQRRISEPRRSSQSPVEPPLDSLSGPGRSMARVVLYPRVRRLGRTTRLAMNARGSSLEREMNYADLDFLLDILTFVVPLAIALGTAMLGSYLVITLPASMRRRARRSAAAHAAPPEPSLATVIPLRAYSLDLCDSWTGMQMVHTDRRSA